MSTNQAATQRLAPPPANRPGGATSMPAVHRPRDEPAIVTMLKSDRTQAMMRAIVPKHVTPDRMMRLAVLAVTRTPKLAECHPQTLLGAFISCSALGLEPNTPLQHVHLIPFENRRRGIVEVQTIIGYRGYMELGRRSGLILQQHAEVAFSNDLFEYEFGTETRLRHIPVMDGTDRGDPIAAYCHVKLTDGQAFTVMPWADVLKIRDGSQGYQSAVRFNKSDNPWQVHPLRMGRKTAIRQLYSGGEVPLSLEMANAALIDERRVDFAAIADASADEVVEGMGTFAVTEGDGADEDRGDSGQDQGQEPEGEEAQREPDSEPAKPDEAEPKPDKKPAATKAKPAAGGDDLLGDME